MQSRRFGERQIARSASYDSRSADSCEEVSDASSGRVHNDYGQHPQRCWIYVTPTQTQELFSVRTLGVDEISRIVRQSRSVVLRTLRTHPDRLPKPAKRVGRNYLWLPDEVESWLRAGRSSIIQTGPDTLTPGQQKRSRGRPRKELRQLSRGGEK